ncbi:MAG: hypothetical protein IT279_00510 [Ignavibacteriaceae bacterium]|nr:hypothetical protein [Ignavibacteriaceae bacterium]
MSAMLYDYKRPGSGLLIITILGIRATLNDAGSFRDKLLEEIQNGYKVIIVNFERVEFIDSQSLVLWWSAGRKSTHWTDHLCLQT